MVEVMVEADVSTLEAILEGFDHILRGLLLKDISEVFYLFIFLFAVGAEDVYSRGNAHYNMFSLYFDTPAIKEKVIIQYEWLREVELADN